MQSAILWMEFPVDICNTKFIWSSVSFKVTLYLMIFCLANLSTDVSGMLKFPIIVVLMSVSPLMAVCICFIYFDAPILDAYMFRNVISSCIDAFIFI